MTSWKVIQFRKEKSKIFHSFEISVSNERKKK